MTSKMMFAILNRSRDLTTNAILIVRSYSTTTTTTTTTSRRKNLFSRICPMGDPSFSVVPVLDQWVQEGNKVKNLELQRIVRDLRARRRYNQALEVSLFSG